MLPRKEAVLLFVICTATLLQEVLAQSKISPDGSDILLSSLDPKELDELLDARLEELQMDVFRAYQDQVRDYEKTVAQLHRRKRDLAHYDPVAVLPPFDATVGHSYKFDTRVGNREVVKIDSFDLEGYLGSLEITDVFPLNLANLSAIYKGKDGLGYFSKDGILKVLKVRNEWTASTNGCRCDGSSPKVSRSHESCACCVSGGCLCEYALGFERDTCVPCGTEAANCPKASSSDLQLDAAVGLEYTLPVIGLQQIVITAKSTVLSFYRIDEYGLQIMRSITGLSVLNSAHPVTHLGYGEVYVDYHGVLKKKRFLITFCSGQSVQQLHELMVGTQKSALAVGLSSIWQASGTAMKVSHSGGRLMITVLDGDRLQVYELKEDLWREFEFLKIQRLSLPTPVTQWSFFSTGFENYLILASDSLVRIYIQSGLYYQSLIALTLDGVLTRFDNFMAVNMRSCRNEVVLLAGSGSRAALYVLDWSVLPPTIQKVNVFTVEVDIPRWSLAFGFSDGNLLKVVIPGQNVPAIYAIRAHLEDVKDPIWKENQALSNSIRSLKAEYGRQTSIMNRTEDRLSQSVDSNFNVTVRGNLTITKSLYISHNFITNVLIANKITLPGTDMAGGVTSNDYALYLAKFNATQRRVNATLAQLTVLESKINDIILIGGVDKTIGGYTTIINPGLSLLTLIVNNINIGRVLDINGSPVALTDMLRRLVRLGTNNKVTGKKTFINGLVVGELHTDILDDVPVNDLVTVKDEQIIWGAIYRSVFFAQTIILKPGATIAGLDLSKSVLLNSAVRLGRVIFESVKIEANIQVISSIVNDIDISRLFLNVLTLSGGDVAGSLAFTKELIISNLDTTKIQGINIGDFLNNTVFKDRAAIIDGKITVAGPVVVKNLQVSGKINHRSFPEDYPIKTDASPIIFAGQKQFNIVKFGNLKFGLQGTVDGLDPNTLVTKSIAQFISASKVFGQGIRIEGNLDILSKIIDGVNLDELLRSRAQLPTTDPWKFDVVFTGSVTMPKLVYSGLLNGVRFSSIANDIVYDDIPAKIKGVKKFNSGLSVGIAQIIGTLNGEDINSLVTTSKNYVISGSKTFIQEITFNLLTTAIIDGEDLDALLKSLIQLDKDNVVTGKKIFTNKVFIHSLEVQGKLSNVDFSKVVTKSGNQLFTASQTLSAATYTSLQVQSIKLTNLNTVNGFDISDLAARRLSLKNSVNHTGTLIVDGPFIVVGNLMADKINGFDIQQLQDNIVTNSGNSTISGPITISSLVVSGSLQTWDGIGANGYSLRNLSRNAAKLAGTNTFTGTPIFNELELRNNIGVHGFVNSVDLVALRDEAVFTNLDTFQLIMGTKMFLNGFDVRGNIDTDTTNGVDLSTRLFTLHTDQHISSYFGFQSIVAKGDVLLLGLFNDIDLRSLKSSVINQTRYASVNFLGNVKIGDLRIEGGLDGVNLTARFADAVRLRDTGVFITGKKTFRANTQFSNLKVNNLNSIFLNDYLANVVLRTSNKVLTTLLSIRGDVSAPWITADNIIVEGTIDGVDYKRLKRDVIYLSKPQNILTELIFERSIHVKGNINTIFLNGRHLLEDYLTVRTEQLLDVEATLATISSTFIEVGGTVNNIYLPSLQDLTMQAVGGQVLSGLTIIKGNTTVLGNIDVTGKTGTDVLIKLSSEVIDLLKGGDIGGLLRFTRELVTSTLTSSTYLVNGINLLSLYNNAWFRDVASVISAKIVFTNTVTFNLGIIVTGTVDRLNIGSLYNRTTEILAQFGDTTKDIRAEYAAMCNSNVRLYEQLQDSLYEGECFEFVYAEVFPNLRHSSITFNAFNKTYLMLSYERQCYSEVYTWNNFTRSFSYLVSLSTTGFAHGWVHLETSNGKVYVAAAASYSHNSCQDSNSTIWEITSTNIKLVRILASGEKVSKKVSSGKTFIHIHATHSTITYEYSVDQARWVELHSSEPFEFALHVLDERGIDVSFRSNGGLGEVWVGGVAKQTINLGYAIHDVVLINHHQKPILFVVIDQYNPKGHSYELRAYEILYGKLIWLDSATLQTLGKISLFVVGNEACGSIFIAITQENLFPVIYNFFSETLTEWNQMVVPRTTWIQYFGVPNKRFQRIMDHYIIFGRGDNSALIYSLIMRGATVPKISYSCEIEAFTSPLLKPVAQR